MKKLKNSTFKKVKQELKEMWFSKSEIKDLQNNLK